MKKVLAALIIAPVALVASEVPEVLTATMSQPGPDRLVTINYTFQNGPAVITLDIQTNANNVAWASIGGEAIWNATGDVWKKVEGTSGTITWRPDLSWPGHKIEDGNARAVVTAWSLGNTPDYMVVDLAENQNVRYYPSVEFLPKNDYEQEGAAVTNNPAFKTTQLVMRKIMAKDITWTMGSVAESGRTPNREKTHTVTLANNYYIGVYPVTQTQWQLVTDYNPSYFTTDRTMRPVERVSYTDIRQGKGTASSVASATGGVYPAAPYDESFLGLLRAKSGLDFDLPSEAQWEFAARAGHGEGYWGDGSAMRINSGKDVGLDILGRYQYNGGKTGTNSSTDPAADCEVTNGTTIVGSYLPNAWGIYDMHGNVWEWCLDLFADDITALNGAVNISSGTTRLLRGGSWYYPAVNCRSASRNNSGPANRSSNNGFRVVCRAGLD